jgi:hypothetical protein
VNSPGLLDFSENSLLKRKLYWIVIVIVPLTKTVRKEENKENLLHLKII